MVSAPTPVPVEHVSFKNLQLQPDHPPHSAWGLWGPDDQLGCLNRLTPDRIRAAATEVKTGVSIGLNWSLNEMHIPPFYRTKLKHEIFQLGENVNDDRVEFNTQTSSQWDGFRHWGYPDGRFYNGFTQTELKAMTSERNGMQEWAKRGIVGRGVLIDYVKYAKDSGLPYDPWSATSISVSTVKEIARKYTITFQPGDILLLRTGFVERYSSLSEDELQKKMESKEMAYPGLTGSLESLEWLWETQFSCVASDSPGFEVWDAGLAGMENLMHPTLLSGFGMPIGELFDLEELSKQCAKEGRWTFMFTSEVLNIPGGVASPPNALAIL
ncbi:hypothetical protein A1O3_03770 [Capronia epimyces CBS 606.96]|uniref:Cyclase n=1 Tax=Capronia epimyces CBS 606.96 TaxID=1182542 RepID=W9YC30_9EURO|nr:uncharacterized protein A1O3_03770 [Capronia epimyces CBS 606.96]EXJ86816.1 hypothetical protein A1O3_03770 [Capronia epimyces CBS 606.96]